MPGRPVEYSIDSPTDIFVDIHFKTNTDPAIQAYELPESGDYVLRVGRIRHYFQGGRQHAIAVLQQCLTKANREIPEEEMGL